MLSVAVISPIFLDLYPFSVFPMFSDNTSHHVFVDLHDANGVAIDPAAYGLQKLQIGNRDQRYGFDRGPCYFDQHQRIDPDRVREFLRRHYAAQSYPIGVTYRVRGFDKSVGKVRDLVGPHNFTVDLSARICGGSDE